MQTDRELLELAAKAAGYTTWNAEWWAMCDGENHWDPLRHNGQALRLAVKLRIKFRYNEALGQALAWIGGASELDDSRANIEDCGRDEYACARLAIVRAAASVGGRVP